MQTNHSVKTGTISAFSIIFRDSEVSALGSHDRTTRLTLCAKCQTPNQAMTLSRDSKDSVCVRARHAQNNRTSGCGKRCSIGTVTCTTAQTARRAITNGRDDRVQLHLETVPNYQAACLTSTHDPANSESSLLLIDKLCKRAHRQRIQANNKAHPSHLVSTQIPELRWSLHAYKCQRG